MITAVKITCVGQTATKSADAEDQPVKQVRDVVVQIISLSVNWQPYGGTYRRCAKELMKLGIMATATQTIDGGHRTGCWRI